MMFRVVCFDRLSGNIRLVEIIYWSSKPAVRFNNFLIFRRFNKIAKSDYYLLSIKSTTISDSCGFDRPKIIGKVQKVNHDITGQISKREHDLHPGNITRGGHRKR